MAWVTPSVERLTLAQVIISRLLSLSLMLGSGLTAQSLEPTSHSVSPSLSLSLSLCLCPAHTHFLSQIKHEKKKVTMAY